MKVVKYSLIILAFVLNINGITGEELLHQTGKTSLLVEDDAEYIGGFADHNLNGAPEDNLWRAFFVLHSSGMGSTVVRGKAHDDYPLNSSEFSTTSSLAIDSSGSTEVISRYSFAPDSAHATPFLNNINFQQQVTSGTDSQRYINADYKIINNSIKTLRDGRLMFVYEGDLPQPYFDDDYAGRELEHNSVFEYDLRYSIYSGFCIPDTSIDLEFGNIEGYFGIGADWRSIEEGENYLRNLMDSVTWDSLGDTDCGVYTVIDMPDLASGDTFSFPISFVAAESLSLFQEALDNVYDDHMSIEENRKASERDRLQVSIYPNPFSRATKIKVEYRAREKPISLGIYNLSGKLIKSFKVAANDASGEVNLTWKGRDKSGNKVKPGIYHVSTPDRKVTAKIIHLK